MISNNNNNSSEITDPIDLDDSIMATTDEIQETSKSSAAKSASPTDNNKLTAAEISAIFDARRPIRFALSSSHFITIPMRLLNAELTCAVCLGIIRDCTSVTMCLHRFCSTCIKDSLRLGRKECPQCRISCPSKRNLRPDPVFDSIIASIYPDIEKAELAQELMVQEIIGSTNVSKLAEVALKGVRKQAEVAKEKTFQQQKQIQSNRHAANKFNKQSNSGPVAFNLLPHPRIIQDAATLARFSLSQSRFKAEKLANVEIVRRWLKIKFIKKHQNNENEIKKRPAIH